MKRFIDLLFSFVVLVLGSPVAGVLVLARLALDRRFPFCRTTRVGEGGHPFGMAGVAAETSLGRRLLGAWIRMWDVVRGKMSLVGPVPAKPEDVACYTDEELKILLARPGVVDIASVVFADQEAILGGSKEPGFEYHAVIRPWRSRLELLYVEKRSLSVDLRLMWIAAVGSVNRRRALREVERLVADLGNSPLLVRIAGRKEDLFPYPPPGATAPVWFRFSARGTEGEAAVPGGGRGGTEAGVTDGVGER